MGVVTLTALVTGTIIGSAIFTLPGALGVYGPISIVGFAATAAGSVLLALVFAALARRAPRAGGPYAYTRAAFGDFVGFQTGWNYWIGAWTGAGAIAVSMVGYLGEVVPGLAGNRAAQALTAVGAIALVVAVNSRGVSSGGRASLVLTVAKVVPLIAVGTFGFLAFDRGNWVPANVSAEPDLRAIVLTMTITLFAFVGLESASIPAGDVRDPARTIPRATLLGTGLAAVVYLLGTAAVFGAVPSNELAASEAPFALAAERMAGSWAGTAMSLVAVLSCLGALNGLVLLAGQVPLAAAADRLAPRAFGRVNARHAPYVGVVVSGVLAAGLVTMNFGGAAGVVEVYGQLLIVSTLTTLFPYVFTAGAQLLHLLVERPPVPAGVLARDVGIAGLGLAYAVFAIMGAGVEPVYWGFVIILVGLPLYVLVLRSLSTSR